MVTPCDLTCAGVRGRRKKGVFAVAGGSRLLQTATLCVPSSIVILIVKEYQPCIDFLHILCSCKIDASQTCLLLLLVLQAALMGEAAALSGTARETWSECESCD